MGTAYISQTGDYTYTGTPSGGASATYSMNYRNSNAYKTTETGNGITAQFEGGKTYEAVIDIRSGVTISNLTFYPMLRYADITDDTYEPYSDNVDTRLTENKSDIAVNKTTLGTQCKNLLKNTAVTTTINGVTFTVNDDKSITVNGTATSAGVYAVIGGADVIAGNRYIISGGAGNGGTYGLYTENFGTVQNYGSDSIYVPNTTGKAVFRIFVRPGVTVSNVIFYPMLRYADITDSTYEPYKESVDERLTENKSNAAVNRSTLGYQRKNLLKNTAKTSTISGVTFTVNDDKSVTANGTNSTSNYTNIIVFKGELEGGTYTLTGAVSDAFRIRLGMGTSADGYGSYVGVDRGNGYTFTVAEKALYTVTCQVESGKTASNVIFKPMLRYADITDDTYEPYKESVDERLTENKSNTVINKSTLGYQCKNLHDTLSVNWYQPDKTSVASNGTVTATMTSDTRNFTYANSEHYITLEAGNYIITVNTLEFVSGSAALIRGCNSDNQSLFALPLSSAGLHKATFSLSKKTTIGIMYKLYSQTCTIMIRDADILDGTYEPYQPSVQEQTPYSISVSGKSTSAAISYSGVPTLICLTPNTANSTTGGLYMINSAGAVVKLIAETGIVVAANTANNTFTITNNTTTVMDVCISRCWGR